MMQQRSMKKIRQKSIKYSRKKTLSVQYVQHQAYFLTKIAEKCTKLVYKAPQLLDLMPNNFIIGGLHEQI